MKFPNHIFKHFGFQRSPWIVLGGASILLIVVLILSIQNYRREKTHTSKILLEKGTALIRSFQAGARTGMMGMMWGGAQVQRLMEETARQPDILYLTVIDETGKIMAHNNREKIGEAFLTRPEISVLQAHQTVQWRITEDENGRRAFEVFRLFRPLEMGGPGFRFNSRNHHRSIHMKSMRGKPDWCFPANPDKSKQIIFVGLDITPFEMARSKDIRYMTLMSSILVLLGFGGFVSLFWAESYRTARRSLQDTSAFANEVVSHLPVGLIATNPEGKISFFNGTAEKITGIKRNNALGQDPDEVLPAGWCGMKHHLDSGKTILDAEREFYFSENKPIPVKVSASRIIGASGRFIGDILILKDLGEIRRLQEEVRRNEKLASIGNLAAGVAHEIRNPLSSIKGMVAYLAGKFNNDSEDREAAQIMIQEVDRLNRVISQLLEFAKPAELQPVRSDINSLITQSIRLVRQDIQAKNIDIRFQLTPEPIHARLDPDRLTQCLLNLYLNAIQAMEKGGTLTLSTQKDENNFIIIEVRDNGLGISPENLKRIFDPYFTTKSTGTGIGLAIAHKIIESHKGRIKVRSAPGRETVFTILLPGDRNAS